ncbi:MAG TPA: ATP-binding protein [Planctomycetota bacterium]|nr:ATP-binding protein [Planctomycetota bacterium]
MFEVRTNKGLRASDWNVDVAAMAGSLVHEIKNPLSTININAQLLLEDSGEPQTPREERNVRRLRVIAAEIQRLESIIQAFLRFTERHEVRPIQGNLNEVLEELAEFVTAETEARRVQLRLGLDPNLPSTSYDPLLIRQVFLNLIQNAYQIMNDSGGELMLRTRVDAEDGEEWIVGEVIDTGPGISERGIERLFELYYSTREGGNGLGLAISKRIIEEHGGFIKVRSEPGKGSQFGVYLPLVRGEDRKESETP